MTQTHGQRVKARILDAGLDLWRETPGNAPSTRAIARRAGLTHGGCLYHFKTAKGLREALSEEAVRTCCPVLVPVLIATGYTPADS